MTVIIESGTAKLCAQLRAAGDPTAEAYCAKYAPGGTEYTYEEEARAVQRARDPTWSYADALTQAGANNLEFNAAMDVYEAQLIASNPSYYSLVKENAIAAQNRQIAEDKYGGVAVNTALFSPNSALSQYVTLETYPQIIAGLAGVAKQDDNEHTLLTAVTNAPTSQVYGPSDGSYTPFTQYTQEAASLPQVNIQPTSYEGGSTLTIPTSGGTDVASPSTYSPGQITINLPASGGNNLPATSGEATQTQTETTQTTQTPTSGILDYFNTMPMATKMVIVVVAIVAVLIIARPIAMPSGAGR